MKKNAFTLIELLVVIAVIIILMSLTSYGVIAAVKKANINRTRSEIMNILTAVKLYKYEVGIFPKAIDKKCLGMRLEEKDIFNNKETTEYGPYYQFKENNSRDIDSENRELIDVWGESFIYYRPDDTYTGLNDKVKDTMDNGYPVIYSKGPNTESDDDDSDEFDDIGTW